jgi:hypothetical protein
VTSSNIVQYIRLENVLAKLMIKMEIDCAVVGQSMVRKLPSSRGQRDYGTYGRKYFDIGIISSHCNFAKSLYVTHISLSLTCGYQWHIRDCKILQCQLRNYPDIDF